MAVKVQASPPPISVLTTQTGLTSSGSSSRVGGGARNMKSMRPNSATIFSMTYFYRAGGGGHGPSTPRIRYCSLTDKMSLVGLLHLLKILGQKAETSTKATLFEPPKNVIHYLHVASMLLFILCDELCYFDQRFIFINAFSGVDPETLVIHLS